jgi:hypothetical protein
LHDLKERCSRFPERTDLLSIVPCCARNVLRRTRNQFNGLRKSLMPFGEPVKPFINRHS